MERAWWQGAVIYQIYPRSFADGNGDGVGDLPGIRSRLDHLVDLGVDALWLSPFYRSPMADFGYDVADHCDVDPVFGTLADADGLVADAHERGLRVIVDFVPNHTSDRHPWFLASRASRADPKRDWYVWRDGRDGPHRSGPGAPPNNWRASFTGDMAWVRDGDGQLRPRFGLAADAGTDTASWTWDDGTAQWYLHTFLPQQPDLDWRNPAVVDAMHDVLRFWLDRGVDGFRVDAITTLGKPEGLPDADPALAAIPHAGLTDEAFVTGAVQGIRTLLDGYGDGRLMVGEVGGVDVPSIMRHVGEDRFHLAFNFPPMFDRWRADRWRRHIDATEAHLADAPGRWPAWVLSNHDNPRHADRFGAEARARAAAVLLLTLRGTAFLYAGEELGLLDADVPPGARLDPGHRDGCRAPLPWTDAPDHGWPVDPPPWLPFPRNAASHNVERLAGDPGSILALYRRLLAARRASPALAAGTFSWRGGPEVPPTALAFRRHDPVTGDERVVAVQLAAAATTLPPITDADDGSPTGAPWLIEVSTDPTRVGRPWDGRLGPDEGVVLRPPDG